MFMPLKIAFIFANSVYPDEIPHCVAFHLGLHRIRKYLFTGTWINKGLNILLNKSLARINKNIFLFEQMV